MRALRDLWIRRVARTNERGSALIIALVFVLLVAVTGSAVLMQQGSAWTVQTAYTEVYDRQYALDGAVDLAIQHVRLDPSAGNATPTDPPSPCSTIAWPGEPLGTYTIDNETYDVYCATDPSSGTIGSSGREDRTITVSICRIGTACMPTKNVAVRAVVRFRDLGGTAANPATRIRSWVHQPECAPPSLETCPVGS